MNLDENEFKRIIEQKIKFYKTNSQTQIVGQCSIDILSSIEKKNILSSLDLVNLCNILNITPNEILEEFVFYKNKFTTEKFCIEFSSLSTDDKLFVIQLIEHLRKKL